MNVDTSKRRARISMERFACSGHLDITIDDRNPEIAGVSLRHHDAHIPYVHIDMDDEKNVEIKEMIHRLKDMTPSKVSI